MSKKKAKLKRFEILVPVHSLWVFRVEAIDEERAIEAVSSGNLEVYETVDEEPDLDSNSYIVNEVVNDKT